MVKKSLHLQVITRFTHFIFASLFDKYDSDKNKVISQPELKNLIQTVKFGNKWITNHDMVVDKVMEDFDDNGDQMITSEEFVRGVTRWLNKATHETKCTDAKRSVEEYDKVSLVILISYFH